MTRRGLAALLVVLLAAGCTSSDEPQGGSRGNAQTDVQAEAQAPAEDAAAVAVGGACPEVARVAPREDGLPPLRLQCLAEGPDIRLSDLRGVPTVINVWAAWCTNCEREMPLFADAARRAGEDIRFLGVHYKATRDQGLAAEQSFGVPFPSVHDEDGDLVVAQLEAYAPPQTIFVAADGRVTGREIGEITSRREMRELIARHLGVAL